MNVKSRETKLINTISSNINNILYFNTVYLFRSLKLNCNATEMEVMFNKSFTSFLKIIISKNNSLLASIYFRTVVY